MMTVGQMIFTVILFAAWIVSTVLAAAGMTSYGKRKEMSAVRYKAATKVVNTFLLFIALIILLIIWGVDIRNLGILLSSVLGLVAIGFFAVWSILSNILSGLVLFLSDAFRMEDQITILPEDIRGKVTDIKLMFVVLEDEEGNILHIPNNVLIQKVIKRSKRTRKTADKSE